MKHLKGLDHPDSKTAEELSAFAPEDEETMERIFSRAEEKYRAKQETPAESEHFEVTEYKPRHILTAVVSLAACAVIGISGWSIWQLSRHKPPVSPSEIVTGQPDSIPFYHLMDGHAVGFAEDSDITPLNTAQREALIQLLAGLSWETIDAPPEDSITEGIWMSTLGDEMGECPDNWYTTVMFSANAVKWVQRDPETMEMTGNVYYAMNAEQYQHLCSIVFPAGNAISAAKPDVPFRAAAEDALANGRDLQFYGNPDEEGFPVLTQEQIDGFLEMMQQVNWQEDETAYDTGGNAIRLFIPADDPMQSQTVYFYKNCITWSESPESSFLHVYPFSEEQYLALHELVFGSSFNADLPFRTDDFRSDICVGVTPAYAPNLIHVLPSLQEEIADAMDESEWTEVEEPSEWDGERTYLYVCGGESGKHYRLVLLGDYLGWEDDETSHTYLCPEAVRLAIEKAMSPPAMAEQNGLDPSRYLIPCDEVYDSYYVWDAVDAYLEENADLSEYQEVVDRFNAEHRTVYYLWNREMCRQNGMSYTWFLVKFLSEMTPEEFGQYLADTYANSSMPDLPPSIPNFDAGEEVTVTISNDNHPRELNDEQKAKLLDFINTYEWIPLRIEGEPEDTPENMFTVSNADGSKYLRFYRSDGLALWKATSNGVTATTYLTLPTDEISRILNE